MLTIKRFYYLLIKKKYFYIRYVINFSENNITLTVIEICLLFNIKNIYLILSIIFWGTISATKII